jgi:hypothetical protein
MKKYLLIISTVIVLKSYSQTDTVIVRNKNYQSISANYQFGDIMPTSDFIKGDNLMGKPLKKYQSFTLKMLWQNPGYSDWQKVFRFPNYGVGLTVGNFYDPAEVGYPLSFFGVFGIPIKRWKKLELYSELQYGLTGNWKHYNPVTNPKNIVIGSIFTFHANIGINACYPITKNLDLTAGMGFMHYSNGGIKRPNQGGFNMLAPNLGMKYHLADRPNVRSIKTPGRLERSNDLYFMLCFGKFQPFENELDTIYFAMDGLSIIYFTQLSNAFRMGYGADINYWYEMNALPAGNVLPHNVKNLSLGFILQPEIIIDRLTLVAGIGIYASNIKYGNFKQTYQRWGVRYDIYKNISIGLNLRAINFQTAEYMEFNLGYRIRWIK